MPLIFPSQLSVVTYLRLRFHAPLVAIGKRRSSCQRIFVARRVTCDAAVLALHGDVAHGMETVDVGLDVVAAAILVSLPDTHGE